MRASETPSDVHLLIKNLRFLDLDLLPDYCNITTSTFRVGKDVHAGHKDRVRAAEWVLYRLFDIWDAKDTKVKLRPYFPALEPVQSIKLRAAWLQWLTQLKASGVLGRECALRKSLFDECKGEKFEEVLFHFSTAVLQKVIKELDFDGRIPPLAQRLAVSNYKCYEDEQWVQHLIYAHESALRSELAKRETCRHRMSSLARTLDNRHKGLELKKSSLETDIRDHESKLQAVGADARNMKKQLRQDCTGDATWLSIIISGDNGQDRDELIERPFTEILAEVKEGQALTIEETPKSLLVELEERIQAQQSRLEEWRDFQMQVSKRHETLIISKSHLKSPIKSPIKSPSKSRGATPAKSTRNQTTGINKSPVTPKQTRPIEMKGVARNLAPLLDVKGSDEAPSTHRSERDLLPNVQSDDTIDFINNKSNSNEHTSQTVGRTSRSRSPLKSGLPRHQHHRTGSGIPSPISPSTRNQPLSFKDETLHEADLYGDRGRLDSVFSTSVSRTLEPREDESQSSHRVVFGRNESLSTRGSPAGFVAAASQHDFPSNEAQTLSERTLQTLQQCHVPKSSDHQQRPFGHSHSKSQPLQQSPNYHSFEALSWSMSESSRPSTAKTTSTQDTQATSGTSEARSRLTQSANVSKSPSPTRNVRTRSNSPVKKTSDTHRDNIIDSPRGAGNNDPAFVESGSQMGEESHTPLSALFSEDADCASVFKARSKLRHSPPDSPLPTPLRDKE